MKPHLIRTLATWQKTDHGFAGTPLGGADGETVQLFDG